MRAMVLEKPQTPLLCASDRRQGPDGDILLEVAACGVCRTDLHVVDGELPNSKLPLIPGHEIVGRVAALGADVAGFAVGERIGVPWLGSPVASVRIVVPAAKICAIGRCLPAIRATAAMRPMRSPMHAIASRCPSEGMMPNRTFLCAGLIGWRSYRMAGAQGQGQWAGAEGRARMRLASTASARPRTSLRRSRPGRARAMPSPAAATRRRKPLRGRSERSGPAFRRDAARPLDAAIIFAPVGELVPLALKA